MSLAEGWLWHVSPSICHIENSRASLWNPRYSEKGDLSGHFARTFSLVMQFLHEYDSISENINSWPLIVNLPLAVWLLIINLPLAVFYWQSLPCKVIDKSKGDLNSSNSNYFPLRPPWSISIALLFFEVPILNFLCAYLPMPITTPSPVGFNRPIISQKLFLKFSCAYPATLIAQDHLFSKL